MKQHITIDQLKEVNDKLKIYLFKSYYEDTQDSYVKIINNTFECDRSWKTTFNNVSKGITIGKMIEILKNTNQTVEFEIDNEKKLNVCIWEKQKDSLLRAPKDFRCIELCDTLWEAIKYIIDTKEDKL